MMNQSAINSPHTRAAGLPAQAALLLIAWPLAAHATAPAVLTALRSLDLSTNASTRGEPAASMGRASR